MLTIKYAVVIRNQYGLLVSTVDTVDSLDLAMKIQKETELPPIEEWRDFGTERYSDVVIVHC